ncbi:PREDICTED: uncharacterized protein LOC100641306 [Amphimedon queenslandica]|uniref:WSC domain-containing protein n=1 Tax=Amphimedon queenslandica TaxID=400682 RepID=A0A1X7U8Z9_AMPQE|nr:PREDICTED: uncharacterized protein LOC100641306 [Amphimedon queenslandica]|eukprot:XP_003388668.1 PREDICTED: uncharacterized protein LOC100641306 [Amphimedon queenslandica]
MKKLLLSFAVLLLPLVVSPYPITNCTSQCWASNELANFMRDKAPAQQRKLLCACSFGCRLDKLNRLMFNSEQCKTSCDEAYDGHNEQMACSTGCNLNKEEDIYNNETVISFMTVIYQTAVLSFDSFWSNSATTNQGGQVVYFVFHNEQETTSDQSTSSSTTTTTVAATEDPKAVELWLIIQILCAILLILSLLCCCCMCSGEARNYSNKKSRSREITNCQEHKECKYKLLNPPPVTAYTLPVKVGGPL